MLETLFRLGAASSAIAILLLGSQAVQFTYRTIEALRNLPAIVINIKNELHVLELVINLANKAAKQNEDAIHRFEHLLQYCTKESARVSALLAKCITR